MESVPVGLLLSEGREVERIAEGGVRLVDDALGRDEFVFVGGVRRSTADDSRPDVGLGCTGEHDCVVQLRHRERR